MKHPQHHQRPSHPPRRGRPEEHAFRDLQASELYCPKCQGARVVRERLLLVLPDGDLHEYRCAVCASSLGTRMVGAPPQRLVR